MVTLNESRHASAFIISEASGNRSRENGVLAADETITAGELLMLSGTELVAYDGETASVPVGISLESHDTNDPSETKRIAYLARDAEVNGLVLTYPDLSSGQEDSITLLADLNIHARL